MILFELMIGGAVLGFFLLLLLLALLLRSPRGGDHRALRPAPCAGGAAGMACPSGLPQPHRAGVTVCDRVAVFGTPFTAARLALAGCRPGWPWFAVLRATRGWEAAVAAGAWWAA